MVVIKIKEGFLRGKTATDIRGSRFYSFQGIPYAEPPTGSLRFKAPQPVKSWSGIRDALEEGNESLSRHMFHRKMVGDEDCLNLNVYTPQIPEQLEQDQSCLKAVMFWIHGGVFSTGSNKTELFGPEFLIPQDVVLVTINYRLGILGFLSLEDSELGVPGNAAFKDMVMALKWVQRNIRYFGGDPGNVTVFGESAGGCAAHLLMLSPMSKGLIHKVIAQSGSALQSWIYGRRTAKLLAEEMGYYSSNEKNILKFLQEAEAEEIYRGQELLESRDFMENEYRCFGFIVEKSVEGEESFLTRQPLEIILSGDYHHIPLMMGYNYMEGMALESLIHPKKRNHFFHNTEIFVPLSLNLQRNSAISRSVADILKTFYFGKKELDRRTDLEKYYKLCTDATFFRDVYFSTKAHLHTLTKPIYFYRLSLESELNFFKKLSGINIKGVYHGDDVGYLFKNSFTPEIKPGSVEDIAMTRMTTMWANFAKFGNPTPGPVDNILNIIWEPVRKDRFNFIDIDEELTMQQDPESETVKLWSRIYKIHPLHAKL